MAIMGILQFRKIEYVLGLQNLMSSQKVIRTLLNDWLIFTLYVIFMTTLLW